MTLSELGYLAALGLAGWALWQQQTRSGRLTALASEGSSRHGVTVFLAAMILQAFLLAAVRDGQDPEDLALVEIATAQAATSALAVVLVVGLAKRLGVHPGLLGLRSHRGPSAALLALAGWLAAAPLVSLAALLNRALTPSGGAQLQDYLQRFLSEEGAANNPVVWLSMVVVIPVTEEVIFRGALFGGLRRLVPPGLAMLASAAVFGAAHDGVAMLPAATLGVLLAWLYERTGSLLAPCLAHCLQNGLVLALATQTEAL